MLSSHFPRATAALLLACLWAATAAVASDIDVDQIGRVPAKLFDEGNGLPDATVTAVAPGTDGHVWVGTMRGLARFNGLRLTPVPGPDGKLGGAVRDIAATPDGRVWVSMTGVGVFVLEDEQWKDVGAGLGATHALRLRWFPNGKESYRLFATRLGGVLEWVEGRWQSRILPAELDELEIFDVALARDGSQSLWLATFGQGLYHCPAAQACLPVVPDEPGPRFFEITSVDTWPEADHGHSLWVGSYGGGVARLHGGQWQRFHTGNGALGSDYVHALLLQDIGQPQPQVWTGLRQGAARLRNGQWQAIDYLTRLTSARTRAIALGSDLQGRPQVWLGTDAGAARLRLVGNWRTVSELGSAGNGVWALLNEESSDGHETLWLGADGEGLARYREGAWRTWTQADGLPHPTVRSLARVADGTPGGTLWVGTWNGHLARMIGDRLVELPTPWAKFEREAVSKILPVGNNEVWVGLRQAGVAHFRDGTWTHYYGGAGTEHPRRVVSLLQTGSGGDRVIWASTVGQGLAAFRDGVWSFHGRAQGLPDDSFFGITLLPDAGGRPVLWLGSQSSGVVRVDITNPARPRLVTEPALPDPPNPYTYGVVRDGAGDLVVCTDYGAARWQPLPDGRFDVLRFQRSDGLPHDECNAGALHVDARGRVWAGTIGGAAVYLPRTPAQRPITPPLVIERLAADGVDIKAGPSGAMLLLPAGTRSLQVEFALLSGEREGLNTYRSWLEGLEPVPGEWNSTPLRQFTGLPPGRYRLNLEARDYTGAGAAPRVVSFEILRPWWSTVPALAAYAIAFLLLALGLLRLRERQLRTRERELVDLVRQRTTELESRSLELRRANEELTRLSYFDALTELANRRRLIERLHAEWAIGLARGTPVAFALFDLDEFKAYNDHKGHLAGDEALRVVARRVEAELRKPHDTAGRYGGEEFGLLLPGLELAEAMAVAERVRQAVMHADLPHPQSRLGRVTISIGVAAIVPRAGLSADLLIAAADAALYRAKQTGKNRVEAAESLD